MLYYLRRRYNMKGFIVGVILTLAVVFPDKTKDVFAWSVEAMENVIAGSETTLDTVSSSIEERSL